jgi:FMN phosphatase YigB (HAD superfamily)
MTTIAFDMDEVIFPFALAYAAWRRTNGLIPFEVANMLRYDFASVLDDAEADGDHTSAFIDDDATLDVLPIDGASAGLAALRRDHRLVIVTNRYATQSPGTLRWLERWMDGIFADIIFPRPRPWGTWRRTKDTVCTGSVWSLWSTTLPSTWPP